MQFQIKDTSTVGVQIRQLREALGMTQAQLAERSSMSQSVIAEIESGKRKDLCLSTIQRIAAGLQCNTTFELNLKKDIEKILDERSTELAKKLVSVTTSSSIIELQKPSDECIKREIQKCKKELLKNKRSFLWQNI